MNEVRRIVFLKDLLIFQSPIIFDMVKPYIESMDRKGVYLGELAINPYIYSTKSLDVPYIISYIKSLDNLAKVFRDMYDDFIHEFRILNLINTEFNDIDNFHMIFNSINNRFNRCLDDPFYFEDFGIYESITSLEVSMDLYKHFIESFTYSIMELLTNIDGYNIKILIQKKNIKYLPYIYDRIFEQFEPIYLPFY